MRALVLLSCLIAWTSSGLELHTWTFARDGKGDALGGEFSFKKGGRLDGIFVRFAETNKVVIKRLPDAVDCRLEISLLSTNDVLYLAKFQKESQRMLNKRLQELEGVESQTQGTRDRITLLSKEDAGYKLRSKTPAGSLNQRSADLKRIESFQAAIEEAQRKLDYEKAATPIEADGDPDFVSTVMEHRARVNLAQGELNHAQRELEKMLDEFKRKYPDR